MYVQYYVSMYVANFVKYVYQIRFQKNSKAAVNMFICMHLEKVLPPPVLRAKKCDSDFKGVWVLIRIMQRLLTADSKYDCIRLLSTSVAFKSFR
jgi:hypothetical protein